MKLPESLAVRPNIEWHKQTATQLIDEYAYWHHKLAQASGWGASLVATCNFQAACEEWLYRLYPEVFVPYWGA